jgi:hypothetical protein
MAHFDLYASLLPHPDILLHLKLFSVSHADINYICTYCRTILIQVSFSLY